MTVVDTVEYTSASEWRRWNGFPELALLAVGDGIQIDNLGRHWDPAKHPRGRDGRFIKVGGLVKVWDELNGGKVTGTGTVKKIDNAGIHVEFNHVNDPANAHLVGTEQVFNKRQISTIPQGQVRLDRNGNVHPHDRELPDKVGKLVRRGDRVRTHDGHEGHVHLVGEDGRVAVRRDDGSIAARKVATIERLDHPNPEQVRPHERAVHDAHAATWETRADGTRVRTDGRIGTNMGRDGRPEGSREPRTPPATPGADRSLLAESLDRAGFGAAARHAARHGSSDNVKQAIQNDPAFARLHERDRQAGHANIRQRGQHQNQEDFARINHAVEHGLAGDAAPEPTVEEHHARVQQARQAEAAAQRAVDARARNPRNGIDRERGILNSQLYEAKRRRKIAEEDAAHAGVRLGPPAPEPAVPSAAPAPAPAPVPAPAPAMERMLRQAARDAGVPDELHNDLMLDMNRDGGPQTELGRAYKARNLAHTNAVRAKENLAYRRRLLAARERGRGNDDPAVADLRQAIPGYEQAARDAETRVGPADRALHDAVQRALGHGDAPGPQIRNLPPGRVVHLPDGENYDAAKVDQMISDLPVVTGRHRALPNNDRYTNNLKYALQDTLDAPNQGERDRLDAKVADYFQRALEGRPAGDPKRAKLEDVQRRWNEMRGHVAELPSEPAVPVAPTPEPEPVLGPAELQDKAATFARRFDEQVHDMMGRQGYRATDLLPGETLHSRLAEAVNNVPMDHVPGEAPSPYVTVKIPSHSEISVPRDVAEGIVNGRITDFNPPPAGTPDSGRDERAPSAVLDRPATPAPAAPPAPPPAPPAPPAPAPAPAPAPVPPAAPAARVPLMEPGIRGRGQHANAVMRNIRGDDLRVGVKVRTNDGLEGYIARVHPPSSRVVVKNRQGLEVMRHMDNVRAQYPPNAPAGAPAAPAAPAVPNAPAVPAPNAPNGVAAAQAIVDMHARGAQQGFPAEPRVVEARAFMELAVRAAREGNAEEFRRNLDGAIGKYSQAKVDGIANARLNADVTRRLDAARQLLNDLNEGRVVVAPPPPIDVAYIDQGRLRQLRNDIPRQQRDLPGGGTPAAQRAYWQAGFSMEDALDTSRPGAERNAALDRTEQRLKDAADGGVRGAAEKLAQFRALRRAQAPGEPAPPVRFDVPRPVSPQALNPNATAADYAGTWGIDRGEAVARAARERPSLDALFTATDRTERLRIASDIFNGQYGSTGLTFKVGFASGGGGSMTVTGHVYKPDGTHAGEFNRYITRDGVYNALFELNDNVRAGGAATEFNYHMENWYIANDIKQVTVTAALSSGGFVWARNGFDWGGGKGSAQALADRIKRIATRMNDQEALAKANDLLSRIQTHEVNDPEFPTPFELSNVGWKPGMGKGDSWIGKTAMMGQSWSGIKRLDPNAKTYQEQVARGKLPDPTITSHPVIEQYDASAIPDSLRAVNVHDLTALGDSGGTIGDWEVSVAGTDDAPQRGHGVNTTWFLKSKTDGRTFIIKNDTETGGPLGVAGEVTASDILRGMNYYGASYVEAHPRDNSAIITTLAGAQRGTVNNTNIQHDRRSYMEVYRNMADPRELLYARIFNAMAANLDRHSGNAMWGQDADGKDHLLLFDHGLAFRDRFGNMSLSRIMGLQRHRIAYSGQLKAYLHDHGPTNTAEIQQIATEILASIQGVAFPTPEGKEAAIRRLQEIIDNPQEFLTNLILNHAEEQHF